MSFVPPTAALASVLQRRLGLRGHCLAGVQALAPGQAAFAGPAHTVRYLPLREDLAAGLAPYNHDGPFARAYEATPPGSVVVIGAERAAGSGILGSMIALRLKLRGAAGVVCDAGMRDVDEMRALGLPVMCAGAAPASSTAALMLVDFGLPIACGGVSVFPGDMVVADADGVVVCPAGEWEAACAEVREREALEAYVKARLEAGEPMTGLYPPGEATRAAWRASLKP